MDHEEYKFVQYILAWRNYKNEAEFLLQQLRRKKTGEDRERAGRVRNLIGINQLKKKLKKHWFNPLLFFNCFNSPPKI